MAGQLQGPLRRLISISYSHHQTALLASIYLMSVPTFLMGCLPTYSQVWTVV